MTVSRLSYRPDGEKGITMNHSINAVIYSSDPEAIEKLQNKLSRLENRKSFMLCANTLVSKGDKAGLLELFAPGLAQKLLTPDVCGNTGFPAYSIAKINADIRRTKARIKQIGSIKSTGPSIEMLNDICIIEDIEVMRIKLHFPSKPSPEVLRRLKTHGFHWSPRETVWQRLISPEARYWAYKIAQGSKVFNPGAIASDRAKEQNRDLQRR